MPRADHQHVRGMAIAAAMRGDRRGVRRDSFGGARRGAAPHSERRIIGMDGLIDANLIVRRNTYLWFWV